MYFSDAMTTIIGPQNGNLTC